MPERDDYSKGIYILYQSINRLRLEGWLPTLILTRILFNDDD